MNLPILYQWTQTLGKAFVTLGRWQVLPLSLFMLSFNSQIYYAMKTKILGFLPSNVECIGRASGTIINIDLTSSRYISNVFIFTPADNRH